MKKMTIIVMAAMAMLSCSKGYQAKEPVLQTQNDSINYALGFLNGSQMKSQFVREDQDMDKNQACKEFVDALQRGWDGKVEDLSQAQSIGRNIGNAVKGMEEKGLLEVPAWTLNEKILFQGLVNGLYKEWGVMSPNDARDFFQIHYQQMVNDTTTERGKAVKAKCGNKPQMIELKSLSDSLNYAFGMSNGDEIGMYVLAADSDGTDKKEFIEAINYALKNSYKFPQLVSTGENVGKTIKQQSANGLIGESALVTDFELIKQGFINGMLDFEGWTIQEANMYIGAAIDQIHKEASKMNIEAGQNFLQENGKRPEVKTTESGLQYEVIKEGKGAYPSATDRVKVHYEGTLIDGKKFDSSYDRGEPITFGLNQVIKGWTEGVQLMPVGSTYKLYIPYELGYGERGAGADIPPYSTLIFTIELLDIEK
ncbi:MAG: FKBP-type peptidyl-prolyl cis-trans isomerase [Paludibacteraceae bacterium]|nr:FKBP-type peptidyl-prolyl cis-trans isomerase [Paludibacteraceae bacterium]